MGDMFDAILDIEGQDYSAGYAQGTKESGAEGFREGWKFGAEKALEIYGQVGEAAGYAQVVKQNIAENPEQYSKRCVLEGRGSGKRLTPEESVVKCVEGIEEMVSEFPVGNPHDEELLERLKAVQNKFKQLKVLLGEKLEKIEGRQAEINF